MKYSVKFYPEIRFEKIDKTKSEKRAEDPDNYKEIVKNVPVMLSVTYSQKRMFYYTGQSCDINQWKPGKEKDETGKLKNNQVAPKGQTSQSFNAELNRIKTAVDDLFKVYEATNVTPTPDQLRNDLKTKLGKEVKKEQEPEKVGFFDRFEQYMKDAPLSHGRVKHVGTTRNKVQSFRPDTTFDSIDSQYLTDFKNYLLGECNLSNNTTVCEIRRLRAFFGWSIKKRWTDNYPFSSFEIGVESYGTPIYITIEERDKLYNAVIVDKTLAIVRDIFVFQCLIGCRVGDLLKLTRANIIGDDLEYIAGKTKDNEPRVVSIPLSGKAKAILAKYNLPEGKILPFLNEPNYNEHLKLLFKLDSVKLTRKVTVPDPKSRMNVQKSIADIVSSHMARKVFIGGLHKKGVKNEIIASMSGHVENSKAFSRYYKVDKEMQRDAMKEIE